MFSDGSYDVKPLLELSDFISVSQKSEIYKNIECCITHQVLFSTTYNVYIPPITTSHRRLTYREYNNTESIMIYFIHIVLFLFLCMYMIKQKWSQMGSMKNTAKHLILRPDTRSISLFLLLLYCFAIYVCICIYMYVYSRFRFIASTPKHFVLNKRLSQIIDILG